MGKYRTIIYKWWFVHRHKFDYQRVPHTEATVMTEMISEVHKQHRGVHKCIPSGITIPQPTDRPQGAWNITANICPPRWMCLKG